MFNDRLVLTKEGLKVSKWRLPEHFKNVTISCHTDRNWHPDGYFQPIARGQEFVVHADKPVEKWAKELINKSKI